MKNIFIASIVSATLFINVAVKADQGDCHGGYSDDFQQVIILNATANVSTNAVGVANLHSDDDDGTNSLDVKVSVAGLDAGTYHASITDVTGTNSFDLGTFEVSTNSFNCEDWDASEFFGDDLTNAPVISTNVVTFGRGKFDLTGLDPTNAAFLFVFDTNGVVAFVGDFTSLTNVSAIYYEETVPVIANTNSAIKGQGKLSLSFKKGKTTSSFKLNANGLAPKQSLVLKANGKSSAKTSASTKGEISIKALPHANLPELRTVEATDKKGGTVFRLEF
jgi:hypothetical protein